MDNTMTFPSVPQPLPELSLFSSVRRNRNSGAGNVATTAMRACRIEKYFIFAVALVEVFIISAFWLRDDKKTYRVSFGLSSAVNTTFGNHEDFDDGLKPAAVLPNDLKSLHLDQDLTWMSSSPPLPGNSFRCAASTRYEWTDVARCVEFPKSQPDYPWCLESYHNMTPKSVGGDEFYASLYNDENVKVAVGWAQDLRNGRYLVRFMPLPNVTLPLTGKRLEIQILYSCSVGSLGPPAKERWEWGGSLHQLVPSQSLKCFGSVPLEKPRFSMSKLKIKEFHIIVAVGDSLLRQLFEGGRSSGHPPQIPVDWKHPRVPLTTETVHSDWLRRIRERLQIARNDNATKIALILASGVWDTLESGRLQQFEGFADHLQALHILFHELTIGKEFRNVTLFWKSMTAMHIQAIGSCSSRCKQRTTYLSNSRAWRLNQLQHETLKRFPQVQILELFDLTYKMGHKCVHGDGRHFRTEVKVEMWNSVVEG